MEADLPSPDRRTFMGMSLGLLLGGGPALEAAMNVSTQAELRLLVSQMLAQCIVEAPSAAMLGKIYSGLQRSEGGRQCLRMTMEQLGYLRPGEAMGTDSWKNLMRECIAMEDAESGAQRRAVAHIAALLHAPAERLSQLLAHKSADPSPK